MVEMKYVGQHVDGMLQRSDSQRVRDSEKGDYVSSQTSRNDCACQIHKIATRAAR
jgi:hypothetical protein